jgi:mono/diheme cytochrome c family protein
MKTSGWIAAAAIAAAIGFAAASAPAGGGAARAAPADPARQYLKSPADIERGREYFAGTCGAYCHKMTPSAGDAPYLFGCPLSLDATDAIMFHTITHGVAGTRMVSFEGAIPDDDIWRIIAYVRSATQCKR